MKGTVQEKKKKSLLPNTLPDPIPYLGLQFRELQWAQVIPRAEPASTTCCVG